MLAGRKAKTMKISNGVNQYKLGPWLVALAALLWAVDAPFRKFLTQDLSSTTIVFMEHLVITVLVLIFFKRYFSEFRSLSWKEWLAVIFIAFGGSALATMFFTQSFHYINPSVAILLQKTQPFIAILLAAVLLREKLSPRFWLWAAVGVFGAYLLSFPELRVSGLEFSGGVAGIIFALSASFFWGGSTVMGRVVLKKLSYQAMTALRFLGALLFLFLLELYFRALGEVASASGKDWLYVGIIAVLAGFISLFIYYRGLRDTRASIATIAELAFPFAAVAVNWIFLDAALEWGQIAGSAILILAVTRLSLQNAEKAASVQS